MNRDEFDRRYGTDRKYATLIFLPHARAKFRKLKVSHRSILSLTILIALTLCFGAYFSFMYFTNVRHEILARNASTRQLERELNAASAVMLKSFGNMERLTRHLLNEQKEREQQLLELKGRYESLRVLTQGQEKIAEAHRAILQRQTLLDRIVEIGFGFAMGVMSSLVASVIWRVGHAQTLSDADAEALELDE